MEKKRLRIFTALVLCLSLIAAACGGGGGGGGGILTSIAVTPATTSIATGATQQFTATGTYSDGSAKDITASVTWASSDDTRATISAGGLATAASNAAGPSTITATSGSVSGSAELKVIVNLPKTGQTTSYGTGKIDDGALQIGVAWPVKRFTAGTGAEDYCVTDNLTGLMWVKAPDSTLRTWEEALSHADGLDLCGYTDWRLPNRKELRSLINYGEANNAGWLNTQGFSNVQAYYYWPSTTYAGNTTLAWIVNMFDGVVGLDNKADNVYVWPVRSGQ